MSNELKPEVGMGATLCFYTDRQAATVIEVKNLKTIVIQTDKATLDPNWKPDFIAGGFCGHVANNNDQKYTYERDPEGLKITFTLRKDGRWVRKGCAMGAGVRLLLGKRREFHDYNF